MKFEISRLTFDLSHFMVGYTWSLCCDIPWVAKSDSSASRNSIRSSKTLNGAGGQRWKIEFIWGNWILIYWQTVGLPLGVHCVCLRAIHSGSLRYLKCIISCGETAIRRRINWCHKECVFTSHWEWRKCNISPHFEPHKLLWFCTTTTLIAELFL